MKKIFWLILLGGSMLFGMEGKEIFDVKCASCHSYYIPLSELKKNAQSNNTLLKLKAPTLNQLSFGVRLNIGDIKADEESQRLEAEEFIEKYIAAPDRKKNVVPPEMTKFFTTMPDIKEPLDEDEIEALSNFIFDYGEAMMIEHSAPFVSFEKAKELAKQEDKIIMIRGILPYCKWCIKMDREVMVEKEVVEALLKDFVVVKTDVALEKLPLGMKSLGTPSFYFIDKDGTTVIAQIQGYRDKQEFLELLSTIRQKVKQ
ncbi:MAG: Cytochrome c protein [Campylobacterota bacterium]|nr:Cytochrome c protein [Campylobacterota bacterium]